MGSKETRSLTESGVKHIYQFFFLQFIFALPLLIFSVVVFFSEGLRNSVLDSLLHFGAIIIFLELFVLSWLLWAFIDLYNGRNEFGPKHASGIIISIILVVFYSVLFVIEIILSRGFFGGNALISFAARGFPGSIILFIIAAIILSIISRILLMYTLNYSITGFLSENQKQELKNAFYLLVAGPVTFDITGLIAYRMLFKINRETHFRLHEGDLKPQTTAPCPYCNRDISVKSKVCPFCGEQFEKDASLEIDPRLTVDIPKPEYVAPQGYTPIEGPTTEEKKKLFRLIGIIIAIIILIAIIAIVF